MGWLQWLCIFAVSLLARRVDWNWWLVLWIELPHCLSACAESGLKLSTERYAYPIYRSLCLRGEWIEISIVVNRLLTGCVSLLARRVDWNISFCQAFRDTNLVSLLARRVDWNDVQLSDGNTEHCLSACAESGLKFLFRSPTGVIARLSACAESGLKCHVNRNRTIHRRLSACAESGLKSWPVFKHWWHGCLSACAESGLKYRCFQELPNRLGSLCLRGEWIEIWNNRNNGKCGKSLSACAESGLKCLRCLFLLPGAESLCLRGEWIEICRYCFTSCTVSVSLLARRVDWNYFLLHLWLTVPMSLCLRGEWIEILILTGRENSGRRSLCLRGEWIEIDIPAYRFRTYRSLCLRGEWIEIIYESRRWSPGGVSLLARRVDWNKTAGDYFEVIPGLSACAESGLKLIRTTRASNNRHLLWGRGVFIRRGIHCSFLPFQLAIWQAEFWWIMYLSRLWQYSRQTAFRVCCLAPVKVREQRCFMVLGFAGVFVCLICRRDSDIWELVRK